MSVNIDLRLGDCLELMRDMPDKSIDLIVTDPPYIISTKGAGIMRKKQIKTYNAIEPIASGYDARIIPELIRLMRQINIYIWLSHAQLLPTLNLFVNEYRCNYTVIAWHKTSCPPFCNNNYLKDSEYCIHFRERGVPIYGDYQTKKTYYVTGINRDKDRYKHPTIKPLQIITNMIINSSREGDTVLDPFMGSGTTGAACINTGRNFIGCEIDPGYYELAKKRLEAVQEPLYYV